MADQTSLLDRLQKLSTLRHRGILTTTECAFRFMDLVGDAPAAAPDLFPQLDDEVADVVRRVISEGPHDYYAGRFSTLSNPPTPVVDRVLITEDLPPQILCFRRGNDTPFEVEPQHPFRLAFQALESFLVNRQPTQRGR